MRARETGGGDFRGGSLCEDSGVTIETKALDGLTLLAQTALESAEAQAFLSSTPTVEALMPALDVSALGSMRVLPPRAELPEDDDEA